MKKLLCLYKNEKLIYSTYQINPLLSDAIMGFKHFTESNYNDVLEFIKFGNYIISVKFMDEHMLVAIDEVKINLEELITNLKKNKYQDIEKYDLYNQRENNDNHLIK